MFNHKVLPIMSTDEEIKSRLERYVTNPDLPLRNREVCIDVCEAMNHAAKLIFEAKCEFLVAQAAVKAFDRIVIKQDINDIPGDPEDDTEDEVLHEIFRTTFPSFQAVKKALENAPDQGYTPQELEERVSTEYYQHNSDDSQALDFPLE